MNRMIMDKINAKVPIKKVLDLHTSIGTSNLMVFAIALCASLSYYGYSSISKNRKILQETEPKETKDLYPDRYQNGETFK
ncbi:hypothetical protein BpHYR1_014667 [Brachionus plicatilis]|uniref:Uncharacterized protein n=1 Tax=Brachionus plicatilis TaxID=10195 RepID=A0A3M7RHT8_BRAPC|nr:hypothetical protein BpHYR1_014667 [Brachionus plicatilis]